MMEHALRPHWQVDTCPAWCTRAHAESDLPDDRRHESQGYEFPVIALFQDYEENDRIEQVEAIDMVAVMNRRDGENATWLYVGEQEGNRQRIEISMESAQRLCQHLAELLATTGC